MKRWNTSKVIHDCSTTFPAPEVGVYDPPNDDSDQSVVMSPGGCKNMWLVGTTGSSGNDAYVWILDQEGTANARWFIWASVTVEARGGGISLLAVPEHSKFYVQVLGNVSYNDTIRIGWT